MKYNANDLNKNFQPLHFKNAEVGLKIIISNGLFEFEDAEIRSIKTLPDGRKQMRYCFLAQRDQNHTFLKVLTTLEHIESRLSRANEKPSSFVAKMNNKKEF